MEHHKKEFSPGTVNPYPRSNPRCWRGSIRVATVSEATDEHGHAVISKNGKPKLNKKWDTLTKVFSDIECTTYKYKGEVRYRGVDTADKALKNWRDELIAQSDAEYEAAIAHDEAKKLEHDFKYASMLVPDYMSMVFKRWEERRKKRNGDIDNHGLEASTLSGYRDATARLIDYLSDKPIGEITEDDLRAFNSFYAKKGLSSTTRNKALRVFKSAFDEEKDHIGTDPFTHRKEWWPSMNKPKSNPLDDKSLDRLKEMIDDSECTEFMCAVELAYRTGMRVGEICALRWGDVDLEKKVIHVRKAIGRTSGGTYIKEPKSENGKRDIPLTTKTQAMLDRRKRYVEERIGKSIEPSMYVTSDNPSSYSNPTIVGRTWRGYSQGLMGIAGKRPTFHDLRHNFASYYIRHSKRNETQTALNLSHILGHADVMTTLRIYASFFKDDCREDMESMDEVL